MQIETMTNILRKIEEYNKIIIFRHSRPDGDAVGSTKGLREILRDSYPEKSVYLINNDYSEYLSFLGGEDDAPESDDFYSDALAIVIDTATFDRISNPKFSLCKEIIKIDHHLDVKPYGDIQWIDDLKSSASEMIAEFYFAFKNKLILSKDAATYIYTGMVTDSGRFRFRSVSGDTMRYAGMLMDTGIDTDALYAHLYMKDFDLLKFQAFVYKKMKITKNGVVYVVIDKAIQEKFALSSEDASSCVSFMESIKDCLIWMAFIENPDGSIRVRLRSRFVHINSLAEAYRGGGHQCACGATVYDDKEIKSLVKDADALLKEYKANNEGWL